jgi:hypothetical protein
MVLDSKKLLEVMEYALGLDFEVNGINNYIDVLFENYDPSL